ncbi:hypothetical protein Nepgr_023482, partial [Nepenthes gracilis]
AIIRSQVINPNSAVEACGSVAFGCEIRFGSLDREFDLNVGLRTLIWWWFLLSPVMLEK